TKAPVSDGGFSFGGRRFSAVFAVEDLYHFCKIVGKRRGKRHSLSARRMRYLELVCVQQLPFQPELVRSAVSPVAYHGMSDRLRVHSYLVRSARLQYEFRESVSRITLYDPVIGHGEPARTRHRIYLAVLF